MDLSKLTDEELRKEQERRLADRLQAYKLARMAHVELILKHIDVLLEFTPEHTFRDCKEGSYINIDRCQRCSLTNIKDLEWVGDRSVSVELFY